MNFSLRLRALREAKGLKQNQMPELVGTTARIYGSWERGETPILLEDAFKCAQVLGCTPNDLCGWPPGLNEGAADNLDPEEGELLYCYRQSTEKRRSKILETARDQAELSQAQAASPEIEGLEADQVRSA